MENNIGRKLETAEKVLIGKKHTFSVVSETLPFILFRLKVYYYIE